MVQGSGGGVALQPAATLIAPPMENILPSRVASAKRLIAPALENRVPFTLALCITLIAPLASQKTLEDFAPLVNFISESALKITSPFIFIIKTASGLFPPSRVRTPVIFPAEIIEYTPGGIVSLRNAAL